MSDDPDINELLNMLTYCRADGSDGERLFIERFIDVLPGVQNVDGYAFKVTVGDDAPVLFSCHTDTVHAKSDPNRQPVDYDTNLGLAMTASQKPLGADDAAGCWLLIQMIRAGVPGTYLFHRCEERGGIGSSNMAAHYGDWLKQFKYAVAFDRRGTGDIITYQGGDRCCSTAFAQALADVLNAEDKHFSYAPCSGGVFTDTANYTDFIPECTNVSVGYNHEHSANETLDIDHILALRDALLVINWAALPCERDPSVLDSLYSGRWGGYGGFDRSDTVHYGRSKALDYLPGPKDTVEYTEADLYDMTLEDMEDAAYSAPAAFAAAVFSLMWREDDDV